MSAAGIQDKPEDIQCSIFLHVASAEARVHANMHFTASQDDKIEPFVSTFQEHCYGCSNLIIMRYHFNTYIQSSEDTTTYITALQNQVTDCEYGTTEESLLCDRIVANVHSTDLQNKLLQTADLTLQKCIQICRLSEFEAQQLEDPTDSHMRKVDAIARSTLTKNTPAILENMWPEQQQQQHHW